MKIKALTPSLCIGILFAFYGVFSISNYLHYGAESIFYNGLLRILSGESYISNGFEQQLSLSTYFPTTYLLYYPWAYLLDIKEGQTLAYLCRLLNPFYIFIYLFLIKKLLEGLQGHNYSKNFLVVGLLMFSFNEFTGLFCFKPDSHALFLQIIGVLLALLWAQKYHRKYLVLSALTFALAASIKLNMVGMGVGVAAGLVFSKRWKDFSIFAALGLLVLSGLCSAIYLYMGDSLFNQLVQTTQSDLYPLKKIPSILIRIFYKIVFPYLIFFYLAWKEVFTKDSWNPTQKKILIFCMTIPALLALFGQMKVGAETNYFYDLVTFSIIMAAFAIERLNSIDLKKNFYAMSLVLLLVSIIKCSFLPVQIIANDLRNYDYRDAIEYIDQHIEKPRVYTENNNATIQLGSRSVIGAGLFNFIHATSSIKKQVPLMSSSINQNGGVNAIFVASSNCANFRPKEYFSENLKDLDKLVYHKKKICIFMDSKKH